MTATATVQRLAPVRHRGFGRVGSGMADILAVTWRNLLGYIRVPQLLVFSTIQPVIFVLMFRYVFGGAIKVPGESYVNFLMPGIFAQTVVFGSIGTAIGLATDLNTGLLERFRSLPMARPAVLAGRTTADLARNVFVVLLMASVGFIVGFRVQTNALEFAAGLLLIILFGYTFSWIFATVGLWTRDPEAAQAAAFPVMAPLVFASSAFVPTSTMPSWLRAFADHQPVSLTTDAVRGLMVTGANVGDIVQALAWCAGILAIAVPLAIWRYQRTA